MASEERGGDDVETPLGKGLLRTSCLVILALAPSLVAGMMVVLVIPILPAIAEHFGGAGDGKLLAQYVMAIAGIGVVLGALAGGYGVDRVGCRWVMILALIVYAISGLSVPFLTSANELLASRFMMGLGNGAFYGAATALLALWTGKSRARLLGYVTAVAGAIGIPTILASGAIADAYGWQAPFYLYAFAIPLVPLCFAIPTQVRKAAPTVSVTWPEWRDLPYASRHHHCPRLHSLSRPTSVHRPTKGYGLSRPTPWRTRSRSASRAGSRAVSVPRAPWRYGHVVEGNFDNYPLVRIANTPNINVHFGGLTGHRRCSEMGEPPVGPVGPAIGNAIFAATGKRLRAMPFRKEMETWGVTSI